jgi:hypothetical protein
MEAIQKLYSEPKVHFFTLQDNITPKGRKLRNRASFSLFIFSFYNKMRVKLLDKGLFLKITDCKK